MCKKRLLLLSVGSLIIITAARYEAFASEESKMFLSNLLDRHKGSPLSPFVETTLVGGQRLIDLVQQGANRQGNPVVPQVGDPYFNQEFLNGIEFGFSRVVECMENLQLSNDEALALMNVCFEPKNLQLFEDIVKGEFSMSETAAISVLVKLGLGGLIKPNRTARQIVRPLRKLLIELQEEVAPSVVQVTKEVANPKPFRFPVAKEKRAQEPFMFEKPASAISLEDFKREKMTQTEPHLTGFRDAPPVFNVDRPDQFNKIEIPAIVDVLCHPNRRRGFVGLDVFSRPITEEAAEIELRKLGLEELKRNNRSAKQVFMILYILSLAIEEAIG